MCLTYKIHLVIGFVLHAVVHVWRSEEAACETWLSTSPMWALGEQTQIVRLGDKYFPL